MGKIIQLDEKLSNMIAAGEVVENMASVIKELLENAIDAGSDVITITLRESGLSSIEVSDNGEGMDEDDLKNAFKRHATSKIKTHHDLHHIGSLGFRGEALPSIASVSKMTVESSTTNQPGHKIELEHGTITAFTKGRAKKGTTVSVDSLFYNTPARLKHLRSEQRELSHIVDYVNKIALSHPDIAFELRNNNKRLLKTTGDGDRLRILHEIYPLEIIKNMVPFRNKNQYFEISGYLAKPAYHRSSNQHMSIATNRRIIKNKRLVNAIREGYRTYLPMHKSPIVFMEIDVDPILIDVNIHPQKLEVKFSEQHSLESLIASTIQATLKQENLIPSAKKDPYPERQESTQQKIRFTEPKETASTGPETAQPSQESAPATTYRQSENEIPPRDASAVQDTPSLYETLCVKKSDRAFPEIEYIGQYLGTYLLFQSEEGLYIMDQHAAAERIRYERYLQRMSTDPGTKQMLLAPLELHLSSDEVAAYETYKDTLTSFGLKTSLKDHASLNIEAVPGWFRRNLEHEYAESMVRHLLADESLSIATIIDQLAKDLACKHSIRANKYLSRSEVDTLLKDLKNADNPFTCPHGRPTLITITVRELETMFKRVQ